MAKFYFDAKNGYVTADGVLADSFTEKDKDFSLGYHCEGFEPLFVKMSSTPASVVKDVNVCRLGQGMYYLTFSPSPVYRRDPEILFQTACRAGNVSHLVTMCKLGGYGLVVETAEEIHEIACPCALSDITVSATLLKEGHLIKITAKAENKKFVAVIFYNEDYLPLFVGFFDDVRFEGADIVCTENRGGCNVCVRTSTFTYKNGKFCENALSFIYKRDHEYPEELLPYVFLEKLLFGDTVGAEELLRRNLTLSAVKEILGDFNNIADFDFLSYRPYVVGIYKASQFCTVRYFRFEIRDGLISDIITCNAPCL